MRAVIQRVTKASVTINKNIFSSISKGLLVFIGIEDRDNSDDISWLSNKICNLRIFNDKDGIMNLSVKDIGGEILLVSQFTLHASSKKGNRPSYLKASKPDTAIPIYESLVIQLQQDSGKEIKTGIFGAEMMISITNEGPVTILIDTKNKE